MSADAGSIVWSAGVPTPDANWFVSDGALGNWARIDKDVTEAQVRAAFLETADYSEATAPIELEVEKYEPGSYQPAFAHLAKGR